MSTVEAQKLNKTDYQEEESANPMNRPSQQMLIDPFAIQPGM